MNAPVGTERDGTAGPPTYGFTFGHYTQNAPWADVQTLTWAELIEQLTQHATGPKEGSCIVPATFSGTRRHKADARRIDAVFLDSDAGATLEEITAAVQAQGWAAIISSTHSHLSTRTVAKRGTWDKFRVTAEDQALAAAAFLVQEKGYLPRVAEGARVVEETAEQVVFEHQPCPKFRLALPLLRPWLASGYDDQRRANAAWKERIEALAAALGLTHDQACTDTSRLFYLPRRPLDGPLPETAVLEGEPCDIFALPPASKGGLFGAPPPRGKAGGTRKRNDEHARTEFTDPNTGEVLDLTAWARKHAWRFEIAKALRARRPDVFVGKTAEGIKHHLRCANEDAHTQAGADAATFVVNASESTSRGFVYHCRHAHCDGHDRLAFLRQMLEQGWLSTRDLTDARFQADDGQVRPLIRFVAGKIPTVVDEAEAALLRANLGIYQRGTFIVRPGLVLVTVSQHRKVSAQRILELGDHAMVEAMTVAADWERFDGRSEEWVTIDAPMKVAITYRQRAGRWRLPILAGIINAPTLRADGTILAAPGYDRATGLLLDTQGVRFPAVPERPTQADAGQALTVLDELISTFPFVDRASRAVALSAVLTACIRRSLATAPMHAFTAPAAGSGKSMLVDLASVIAVGREAGVIAQGKTEEELEKRLGALLLAGDQVVAIDNCEAPLGGEFLCSMLTQVVVRPRILGRSEVPELPANAFVTATGNNLVLVGDVTRRALLCRLDPQCERPELRTFDHDPIAIVKANRGRYVAAALTVLRAYHVAGRPKQRDPLGSFHEWSRWVRDALIWLGQADPVETMKQVRDSDPKLDALTAVLTQWWSVIGQERVSGRDIIERATGTHIPLGAGFYAKPEFCRPDFREALLTVAGDAGAVNSRRLSKWITANENRIVGGLRIVRKGMLAGFMTWELEQVEGTDADAA